MSTLLSISDTWQYNLTNSCNERGGVTVSMPDGIAGPDQTRIQNLYDLISLLEITAILNELVSNTDVAQINTFAFQGRWVRPRLNNEVLNPANGETFFERYLQALNVLLGISDLTERDRALVQRVRDAYQAASDRIDDIHFSDARFNALVAREQAISATDTRTGASRTLAALELLIGDIRMELNIDANVSIDQLRTEVGRLCSPGAVAPPPPVETTPPPDTPAPGEIVEPQPQPPTWMEEHFRSAGGGEVLFRGAWTDQENRLGFDPQWMFNLWAVLGFRFAPVEFNAFVCYGESFGQAATDDRIVYKRYSYRGLGGEIGVSLGDRLSLNLTGAWWASRDERYHESLTVIEERDSSLGVIEAGAEVCVTDCEEAEEGEEEGENRGWIYLDAGAIFNSDSGGFIGRLGTNWLWPWGRLDFHADYLWFDEQNRVGGRLDIDFSLWDNPRAGLRLSAGLYIEGLWVGRDDFNVYFEGVVVGHGDFNDGLLNTGVTITVGNPLVRVPLALQGMGM